MEERAIERRWWALAALAALVGLGLRLWHIASTPLWLDEAYSAYAAGHDFTFLWRVVPSYETHPPFYYSLLRLWLLVFGDGLVALRALGLLAGFATPPLLAVCAWSAAGLIDAPRHRRIRIASIAFGLASISIPMVEMSREVRPYPLMILTYVGAMLAVLGIARRVRSGRMIGGAAYAGYLISLAALLWLHNLGILYAAALGLALGVGVAGRLGKADWAWLAIGHGAVALAWWPALTILHDQAPTWIGSTWLRFSWAGVPDKLAVLYAVPGFQAVAALLLAGLGVAALVRFGGDGRRLLAMLLLLAGLPVLLSLAISIGVAPIFLMRTLTPVAAPALLLLALGAGLSSGWRRWLALAGGVMLAANMLSVDLQVRLAGPIQNWYGTTEWLQRRFQPGDVIVAYPNEGALPLSYALRDKGIDWPIRPVPSAVPSFNEQGGRYPTGSRGVVSLPRERLHAIAVAPETRAIPTIWLLRLGAETYDPGDMLLEELHRGRYVIRRWTDGPIDLIGLRRRDLADQRKTKK